MKRIVIGAACIALASVSVLASDLNKEQKRLEESGVVMQEVLNVPDNIPHELLELELQLACVELRRSSSSMRKC